MKHRDWFHLHVAEILSESKTAFVLLLEDGKRIGLPKSHVSDAGRHQQGDKDSSLLVCPWMARQKGLFK